MVRSLFGVDVSEYEPPNGQKLWHSHKIIISDFILATNFIIQNNNKHKTLIEVHSFVPIICMTVKFYSTVFNFGSHTV
jgi:hypothetical protein